MIDFNDYMPTAEELATIPDELNKEARYFNAETGKYENEYGEEVEL